MSRFWLWLENQIKMVNNRGQIGETMTWMVATIIIILVLTVSILLANASFIKGEKKFPYTNHVDLFVEKSLSSYLLTKDSGGASTYAELQNGEVTDFAKNLASNVFVSLYSGYYTYLSVTLDSGKFITGLFTSAGASWADYTFYSTTNLGNKNSIKLEFSHRF